MKLLFAIKTLKKSKGGSERVISIITSELAKKGYDVSLLTFDEEYGDCLYPLDSKVKPNWLHIGRSGEKARVIESFQRIFVLRQFIKKEKPDIVVAFQHSMFILMAFALLGKKIPLISSEHIVPQHYKGKFTEYLLMCVAGYLSDRITVLSESIKQLYPASLHNHMVAIPNPVVFPSENFKQHSTSSSNGVILNIGRLDEQKDHQTLILAFASLHKKYPEWKLNIIGSGKLKESLQMLIKDTGCEETVVLEGNTDQIDKAYLAADIFAMSSLYESFGLVTAEAMAYGLPVVGFADCPGTNELVIDNVNGLLVNGVDRVKALAGGLEKLMLNPELRKTLGENGQREVKKFSTDKILDKWEALINEVVK